MSHPMTSLRCDLYYAILTAAMSIIRVAYVAETLVSTRSVDVSEYL